jgi:hypothetical protein
MSQFGNGTWVDVVKTSIPEHLSYLERNFEIAMTQHGLDEIDAHGCALAAALASGNAELAFEISMNGPLFGKDEQTQDNAVLIIKQGLVDHVSMADPEINLAATMIRLARLNEA